MRDFYDVKILLLVHGNEIDNNVLKKAFNATCKNRGTENLNADAAKIFATIYADNHLRLSWQIYQKKYTYAADISYDEVIESFDLILKKIIIL